MKATTKAKTAIATRFIRVKRNPPLLCSERFVDRDFCDFVDGFEDLLLLLREEADFFELVDFSGILFVILHRSSIAP